MPSAQPRIEDATRAIVHRTSGSTHGPITRLMSPGDLGHVLKPFIFLDLVNFPAGGLGQGFGMHPHSGIATLTFMAEGDARYEDTTGQAGVLLGRYGAAQSAIAAPSDMTYLSVRLREGEHWRYTPPAGHTVAWVAVAVGQLTAGESIAAGELVTFEPSGEAIDFFALAETTFVLGSAVPTRTRW